MDVKLIRAFIASPGGLEAERRAAYRAAEEINRSVAQPLGGRLELIGWEETISGNRRPQAIINAEMETCDLFIGAMWTSWGSRPSTDGPYTSGFEEEFELSRARHALTNSPVMAMYFKDVDPLQLRDPGEDLKKVLDFRAKFQAEKAFMYDTFASLEEFAAKVRVFLSTHVIRVLKDNASPREEHPAQPEQPEALPPPQTGGPLALDDAREADFLVSVSQTFHRKERPLPAEVARLRLIATSASTASNDKQQVGVHDANLLYAHRAEFPFSFVEKRGLLTSGLAGLTNENVPVWSWLAGLNRDHPGLLEVLTIVGDEAERVGALTAKHLLGEPLKPLEFLNGNVVNDYWLLEGVPAVVKVAALQYLRDYGTRAELPAVQREAELAAKETVAAAIEAATMILLRDNEADAVRYLLSVSFETLATDVVRSALSHLVELSSEELTRGLDHRASEVRARTLAMLSERSMLGLETIGRALQDDATIVRVAALRALDRLGQSQSLDEVFKTFNKPKWSESLLSSYPTEINSFDQALFAMYRTERLNAMAAQPLEALLGAPNHRDAAYLSLASRRIGNFGSRLRSDLEDGFRGYCAQHWADFDRRVSAAAGALGLGALNPGEDKRSELIRSSLDVIAAQRDKADLPLIQTVLDANEISPTGTVIAYLRALGSPEDIMRLAKTSQFSLIGFFRDGDLFFDCTAAAQAMLKLLDSPFSTLVKRAMPEYMRARLIDFVPPTEFAKLENGTIVSLLLSEDALVRRATAKKVAGSLTRSRIGKVLSAYHADEKGIYYLVTHWLDLGLAYPRSLSRKIAAGRR